MVADKCAHPVDVCLLSSYAVVLVTNAFTQSVEQAGRLVWCVVGGHDDFPCCVCSVRMYRIARKLMISIKNEHDGFPDLSGKSSAYAAGLLSTTS